MLQLIDTSLSQGRKLLFEAANIQLHRGQAVGVVGLNGCGKSSLFSMIRGELETDSGEYQLQSGLMLAEVAQQSPDTGAAAIEFILDGDEELRRVEAEIERLQSEDEAQHDVDALNRQYEHLERIDGYAARARAARLLDGLGFSQPEHEKPVNAFSGGWRMRLALARALMCRSDLLLLDEPTNHLDLPAIIWLERWLKSYQGLLMVISHDRDFLDSLCSHILHFDHQQLNFYTGNYSAFEQIRAERLANQQSMFEKQQKEIAHMQSYVDRFRYKASKARQAQSRLKMMERLTRIAPAHVDAGFSFRFPEPDRQPEHLLQLENLSAGYDQEILGEVNFSLRAGNRIGLLGVNGAGKSTLLKAIVNGATVLDGTRTINAHARIGYFAQHQLELLNPSLSALDHVREAGPELTEQHLRNHLGQFGFQGEQCEGPIETFSGGEKARLVLSVMVLHKPNLLLLDEPTNHLDLEMRHALSMALVDYRGALVVVSHDRHLLRSACDELWIVHDGRVDEFNDDIDAYGQWLNNQPASSEETKPERTPTLSRKAQRQQQAEERKQTAPLRKRLQAIEKTMAQTRMQLEIVEQQLSDESLYSDPDKKADLIELVAQQGQLKGQLEPLEWEWLEISEQLETRTGN